MDWIHDDGPLDPRQVFLDASDVMSRYGWGKTKGYQNLKNRDLVPPPVMTHPDPWRLDQLQAWVERRMAMAEAALDALVAPDRERRPSPICSPSPSDVVGRRDIAGCCESCRVVFPLRDLNTCSWDWRFWPSWTTWLASASANRLGRP